MPRIIAGSAGGIRLNTTKHEQMRPTSDRFKEAIFSSLQGRQQYGKLNNFLDLFAGCGQIGLEAKSRGVDNVVLVEQNRQAIKVIKENIKKTKLDVTLLPFNAERAIRQLSNENAEFDIIYFDPPWQELNDIWWTEELNIIDILHDEGQVFIEHSKRMEPQFNKTLWTVVKHRNHGENSLLVLGRNKEA